MVGFLNRFRSKREESCGEPFEYLPFLQGGDFRLLKVFPAGTSDPKTGALKLTMHHVNLANPPLYTAVSYMWGPLDDSEHLVIDNLVLPVRANLRRMLCSLRDKREPRYLWIDAICINQANISERNAQVKLIGDIYSKANYVVAYLESTKIRDLRSLSEAAADIHQVAQEKHLRNMRDGAGYELFFNNEYYSQRWIIQELCLARSVILHCGGYQFPMALLEDFLDIPGARYLNSRAARLCKVRRKMRGSSSTLEGLLYDHERAVCSEPLDKIYALWSLSHVAQRHLPVNYGIPPLELLVTVLYVSAAYEDLSPSRMLSFACFLKQHLNITSAEIGQCIRSNTISDALPMRNMLLLRVTVKGAVENLGVHGHAEDYPTQLRSTMPSLNHYRPIELEETDVQDAIGGGAGRWLTFKPGPRDDGADALTSKKIPAIDQCIFSFEQTWHPNSATGEICAGMSSVAIETRDEVWQFCRTPVALIVRRTASGYCFVGRAFMIKLEERRRSSSGGRLEDVLDWIKDRDGGEGEYETRRVAVTMKDLLALMLWVGFDED